VKVLDIALESLPVVGHWLTGRRLATGIYARDLG
jgi:hypothetical protein